MTAYIKLLSITMLCLAMHSCKFQSSFIQKAVVTTPHNHIQLPVKNAFRSGGGFGNKLLFMHSGYAVGKTHGVFLDLNGIPHSNDNGISGFDLGYGYFKNFDEKTLRDQSGNKYTRYNNWISLRAYYGQYWLDTEQSGEDVLFASATSFTQKIFANHSRLMVQGLLGVGGYKAGAIFSFRASANYFHYLKYEMNTRDWDYIESSTTYIRDRFWNKYTYELSASVFRNVADYVRCTLSVGINISEPLTGAVKVGNNDLYNLVKTDVKPTRLITFSVGIMPLR